MRTTEDATIHGYDGISRLSALTHYLPGTSADATWSLARNPASGISSVTRDNDAYAWGGHYAVNRQFRGHDT